MEISGPYPGDLYILRYNFPEGEYKDEERFAINIGIPTGADELEYFDTRYSNRFGSQPFSVCKDCLKIDNQEYVRVEKIMY